MTTDSYEIGKYMFNAVEYVKEKSLYVVCSMLKITHIRADFL